MANDNYTAAIDQASKRIFELRSKKSVQRALLVAISGIDGCGKGYVTSRLASKVEAQDLKVAQINIDGWLNLPSRRFNPDNPAEHFYLHAIRFEEMFAELVLPLREQRSLRLEADLAEETATAYHKHLYEFSDIDVILLEGVYLLKRSLAPHYDLSIWLDCTFETALERAIARAQEGLPPEETVRAYETIYFPAERIHFERDNPRGVASMVIANDPRIV